MINENIFEDEESFMKWFNAMESSLEKLYAIVDPTVSRHLNFSIDSLDLLEGWILVRFINYQEAIAHCHFDVYDGAARYFGEVVRRIVGGEWVPCLDKASSFFGYPAVDNYPGRTVRFAPHLSITSCIERRKGTYLSLIARSIRQMYSNATRLT